MRDPEGVWLRVVRPALLALLAAIGVVVLAIELNGWWIAAAIVPPLVFVVLRLWPGAPAAIVVVGVAVGAIVVPIFALLGVDWVVARFDPKHPPPLASLVVGLLIVGLAARVYLRPWWVRRACKHPLAWTLGIALGLVVAPPVVVWGVGKLTTEDKPALPRAAAVSKLDVIVLRDGADAAVRDDDTNTRGWQIHTWIGSVTGDEIRWGQGGAPPREQRDDTDRVLLLMVDGDPRRLDAARALEEAPREAGEVDRWLGLADAATPASTPTFALLQSTADARLDRWRAALTPGPPEPDGKRHGGADSLQELAGSRTTTDLALRLAVLAPTADQDLALAAKHRPALLFDSTEPYPTPLNVDTMLAGGKVRQCARGQELASLCEPIDDANPLHDADHLAFDPDEVARLTDQSTIYVHVTRPGGTRGDSVYLDYWWYFPHNPADAGHGALCGAGFVIAGVTCFDHQSDWEGVTVVVDPASASPAAVMYAQHDGGTQYTWPALTRLWKSVPPALAKGVDTELRPLVFVARGTHASYPTRCTTDRCPIADVPTNESRHDGKRFWPGNDEERCASICLAALPTRRGGSLRARWNAFDGLWGSSNCALAIICSSSPAPRSPGAQGRYKRPWCAREMVALVGGAFRRTPPGEAQRCT